MKKFFLALFFMVGIFVIVSQGELAWSNRRLLDEARVHKIQKGESLSLLAKRYYGDPHRWRELSLINRAPNANLVLPGEEVLVPDVAAINELSRARTITRVKSVVGEQERVAVAETPAAAQEFSGASSTPAKPAESLQPQASPQTPAVSTASSSNDGQPGATATEPMTAEQQSAETAPFTEESNSEAGFPWFWVALGVILVGGVFAFMRYRQRSSEQNAATEGKSSDNMGRTEQLLRDRRRHAESAASEA